MFRPILFLVFGWAFPIIAHAIPTFPTPFQAVPTINVDSLRHSDCNLPLGYIAVSAQGGVPAYTFSWSSGQTGAVLDDVAAGTYTVTVTDGSGATAMLQVEVEDRTALPIADAGAPQVTPCTNTSVALDGSGSAGPNFTYDWVGLNGGVILSGGQTLTPTIGHAGTFRLTVFNQSTGCLATSETTVTGLLPPPDATATGGQINCASPSVTLGATYDPLNTVFAWTGPAGFTSNLLHPVVTVAGAYTFTVTNVVTGCVSKPVATVTKNILPPDAVASGGGTVTCAQPSVQLLGSSMVTGAVFAWSGPNGFSSNLQNPLATAGGVYTLTVTDPANGCTASDPITVTSSLIPPTASAAAGGMLTCVNLTVQLAGSSSLPGAAYSWSGPNGFASNLQNPVVGATGTYTLTVTNPVNGCSSTATATVAQNIVPPNLSATGATKTCAMPSVTLTAASTTMGVTYAWTGPAGFSSNLQNPVVSVTGQYTVKATNPANGCTSSTVVSVSQNLTPPSLNVTAGTITCTNPLGPLNATSSTSGAAYSWSGPDGFTSGQQNTAAGTQGYYNVTVTSPVNGCTSASSVYLSSNNNPPFAYAGEDRSLNCNFSSLTINASFSSSGNNITYLWTTYDGNIVQGGTTVYPKVDAAGTYTLKVTNTQNGCTALDSVEVVYHAPPTATIIQNSPATCAGVSNGTLKVQAGGGSGSFTYNWSNGAQTATVTGLSAGAYSVTVTDNEACSATTTATVAQLMLLATLTATPQTAPGLNNGTITALASGGTWPYSILWNTGQTSFNLMGLAPGAYTATITDATGCTLARSANVNVANCNVSGSIASINATCAGLANGSATANLTGAALPVTYAWSNGASTKTVAGLAAGTYTLTATDAASCQVVLSTQITAPPALVAAIAAKTDVSCHNGQNGAVTVGVTGGTQPYAYQWSSGATASGLTGLAAATYVLTVTDANLCTTLLTVVIANPVPLAVSVLTKTDVVCPNGATGSITAGAGGGTLPYGFQWSNGGTGATIGGLTVGAYTLTLTDANGCSKSLTAQIVATDQNPPQLLLQNASVDLDQSGQAVIFPGLFDNGSVDAECGIAAWTVSPTSFGCAQVGNRVVTLTATDLSGNTSTGTAMLTVEDNIMPTLICPFDIVAASCQPVVQFTLPQVEDNCPVNPNSLVQIAGLPSGSTFPVGLTQQIFRYTDPSENAAQCSFLIEVAAPVTITAAAVPASCAGSCDGGIALTLGGTSGQATVSWDTGLSGTTLSGLCPGIYVATVNDGFSCVYTQSVEVFAQDQSAPVVVCPPNVVQPYCLGAVQYAAPTVQDNCAVDPAGLAMIQGLPSGSTFPVGNTVQIFQYTDSGGNVGECSFAVTVIGGPLATFGATAATCAGLCDGTAALTLTGGNGPFTQQWSNGQTGATISGLCAGIYTVTITDAGGCSQTGLATVTQPAPLQIVVDQVTGYGGGGSPGSISISASGGTGGYSYSWTRNGQFFSSTQDLSSLQPGQYQVVLTDAAGCTFTGEVITVINLVSAAAEATWASGLTLFPNPASEAFFLRLDAPLDQTLRVTLLHPSGQAVQTQWLTRVDPVIRIDISGLPAGLYLVQLCDEEGRKVVRKVVVSR